MKKVTTAIPVDKVCFVYIYCFVKVEYRPEKAMKVIPSEGSVEMDEDLGDLITIQLHRPRRHLYLIRCDVSFQRTSFPQQEEGAEDPNCGAGS